MMIAANTAKTMASLDGSTGGVSPEAATAANFLMRGVGRNGVDLIDNASLRRTFGEDKDMGRRKIVSSFGNEAVWIIRVLRPREVKNLVRLAQYYSRLIHE